ncbi:hypothetical protein EV13_1294 [Prochlorococcus sp. MIT 0702]|nr:hypothetical protein EV13_1294 [Prochlorococcus sp. MIT 0702]
MRPLRSCSSGLDLNGLQSHWLLVLFHWDRPVLFVSGFATGRPF